MTGIVLHYFEEYGRAEPIRLILKQAGVEFIDHMMTQEQWVAFKQSGAAEFGHVPSLEIDGHHLVESFSIMRYLCKKYNFVGGSAHEDYLADSTCELIRDIFQELFTTKSLEAFKISYLPVKLQLLQKRYNDHGGQYFVGNQITMADFCVFEFVYDYFMRASKREAELPGLTAVAPRLVEYVDSFLKQSANLQAYLQSRPELPF
jgi:glutathione S-transferase